MKEHGKSAKEEPGFINASGSAANILSCTSPSKTFAFSCNHSFNGKFYLWTVIWNRVKHELCPTRYGLIHQKNATIVSYPRNSLITINLAQVPITTDHRSLDFETEANHALSRQIPALCLTLCLNLLVI